MVYVNSTGIPGSNGIRRNTYVFHPWNTLYINIQTLRLIQVGRSPDSDSDSDESDEEDLKV